MTIGVVAGSFDPVTNGHMWLFKKAASVADTVVIAVAHNQAKKHFIGIDDRVRLIAKSIVEVFDQATASKFKIEVLPADKLLSLWCYEQKINLIIRGIRNSTDYQYEADLAETNRQIVKNVQPDYDLETVCFFTDPKNATISSSMVRGLNGFIGAENTVKKQVPAIVYEYLRCRVQS